MQDAPYFQLKYPTILGTDVSGTIVQLGSNVTRFKIGQRVIGHCDHVVTGNPSHAGFQRFSTCREILVAKIPDTLPLANAAVLPLSISTAATGLFKLLALPFPELDPKPTGKTILIWGWELFGWCFCNPVRIFLSLPHSPTLTYREVLLIF